MKHSIIFLLMLYTGAIGYAQGTAFTVRVSNDSILSGNRVMVTYSLENAQGEGFFVDDFVGFRVLSGPSVSNQTSIMNGAVSQRTEYSYILETEAVGMHYLPAAGVVVNGDRLETLPLKVEVYPNPDGIVQPMLPSASDRFFGPDFFGNPGFNQDDFFRDDIWGENFFDQFFQMTPFGEMPMPDSLRQQTPPKKRKTIKL